MTNKDQRSQQDMNQDIANVRGNSEKSDATKKDNSKDKKEKKPGIFSIRRSSSSKTRQTKKS